MRAWFFALVLVLATLPAAAQPKADHAPASAPPPKTERYICPPSKLLNCMPIVPEERRAFCRKDYLDWATKNCSDLRVVY